MLVLSFQELSRPLHTASSLTPETPCQILFPTTCPEWLASEPDTWLSTRMTQKETFPLFFSGYRQRSEAHGRPKQVLCSMELRFRVVVPERNPQDLCQVLAWLFYGAVSQDSFPIYPASSRGHPSPQNFPPTSFEPGWAGVRAQVLTPAQFRFLRGLFAFPETLGTRPPQRGRRKAGSKPTEFRGIISWLGVEVCVWGEVLDFRLLENQLRHLLAA